MSKSYLERLKEDRRLALLQTLQVANGYSAHEHVLRTALGDLGHRMSADTLGTELAWLDEQGLIVLSGELVRVATLTVRGLDVATDMARVPGVARPYP